MSSDLIRCDEPIILTSNVAVRGGAVYINGDQEEGREDDCACPASIDGPMAVACEGKDYLSKPVQNACLASQLDFDYYTCDDLYMEDISNEFSLVLSPASATGPVVINQAARKVWRTYQIPRPLTTNLELWMAEAGLLRLVDGKRRALLVRRQELVAWLHVTDACNLNCPYCYVVKSGHSMALETGLHAVREVFSAAQLSGFSQVKLKYAGGEPTLCFDRVQAFHAEALLCADQTGLPLRAVMLSNGVCVNVQIADWLAETGVKLMISLDGVGAAHDRLRSLVGGQGTFDRITKNVDMLLARGIRPSISITITGQNALDSSAAARWALEHDLSVSVNFYRSPPGRSDQQAMAMEEESVIAGMRAVYQVFAEMMPSRPFLDGLLDRFRFRAHTTTCGAGHAYWVIGHDGRRVDCHMLLDPALDGSPSAQLCNMPVDERLGCRGCFYRYYCTAGCPLESFRHSGRWDAQGPNCGIYQVLAPMALRLEGMRLLKENHLL